ncbi:hypothetical protein, partial [Cnuella takakiae]|uniref:hypothetical protein n=1 Tax=Cnuella takakiae TaxID=1302690 RepID=UPI001C1F5FAF
MAVNTTFLLAMESVAVKGSSSPTTPFFSSLPPLHLKATAFSHWQYPVIKDPIKKESSRNDCAFFLCWKKGNQYRIAGSKPGKRSTNKAATDAYLWPLCFF